MFGILLQSFELKFFELFFLFLSPLTILNGSLLNRLFPMQSLNTFFEKLDQYRDRIPVDQLLAELTELEIDHEQIEPHLRFDSGHYQRNLLRTGDAYHALLLCWQAGQRSPIHDHRGSNCGVRVLRGTATESVFAITEQGQVYPTGSGTLPTGGVCASVDSDIHQVSNLDVSADLVTLHIYSPPLLVMGEYSLMSSQVTEFFDPIYEYSLGGGI